MVLTANALSVAAIAISLLLAGCGGSPAATSTTTSGVSPTITLSTIATGLNVPWEIRFLPDGTMLVTERPGRLVRVDPAMGSVKEVGSIPVNAVGEGGLMGLAIDPEFPDEPFVYVSYTVADAGRPFNRVSRFEIDGAATTTMTLGVERVLLDGIPGGSIHNGSRVAFGPDGYLWVTTGDAGRPELAQDLASPAGKVLRMTRDGAPAPRQPLSRLPGVHVRASQSAGARLPPRERRRLRDRARPGHRRRGQSPGGGNELRLAGGGRSAR